ncbi:MAG TPA: dockerin type I domain-containing protein, partial [Candidatus Binatus sp.]|nr:dockerin type I domain-containing protein [Candidatus Binatus sp.]
KNGQFYSPAGIAIDKLNNIYVTDNGNNRVEKFDSSGNFLFVWGSNGNANGQFFNPQGVTTDSSGMVYVVDSGNNRIEKFTSSGAFATVWGSSGSQPGQFNLPTGISVDSAGDIFVADTYNNRIQMFAGNDTYLTSLGILGSGNGQLTNPEDVQVDSSDNVFVTDGNLFTPGTSSNRVEVFAPIHDTAVKHLGLSRMTAYSGVTLANPIGLNMTVANFGLSNETFWVKAFANSTIIAQQNVTLNAGLSRSILFNWLPNLTIRTTYNITAQVQLLQGDPNPANNIIQAGLFHVRMKGDINGDCKVDIVDLASVGSAFGSTYGSASYKADIDLNNDYAINVVDLVLVAGNFGNVC